MLELEASIIAGAAEMRLIMLPLSFLFSLVAALMQNKAASRGIARPRITQIYIHSRRYQIPSYLSLYKAHHHSAHDTYNTIRTTSALITR